VSGSVYLIVQCIWVRNVVSMTMERLEVECEGCEGDMYCDSVP
jgi:hypothetical protein